jgi:hypothetical protein
MGVVNSDAFRRRAPAAPLPATKTAHLAANATTAAAPAPAAP